MPRSGPVAGRDQQAHDLLEALLVILIKAVHLEGIQVKHPHEKLRRREWQEGERGGGGGEGVDVGVVPLR